MTYPKTVGYNLNITNSQKKIEKTWRQFWLDFLAVPMLACVYFQFQLQNLSGNSMSKFGSSPSPRPSLITYNDPRKIPRAIEFFLSQLKIKDFIPIYWVYFEDM